MREIWKLGMLASLLTGCTAPMDEEDVARAEGNAAVCRTGGTGLGVDVPYYQRKPIIYSGRYFWDDNVKSTALKDYPYWIPEYTSDKCPDLSAAWSHWAIWQYADHGNVAGFSGSGLDMDRFNGGELGLQDMAAN